MADHDNIKPQDTYKSYVRETRTSQPSGSGMALIVGGLVVAVGFVLWLVFGGPGPVATVPAGDTTNVTIEPPAAPADPGAGATVDPVAPAAPADDAGTAPATDGSAAEPAPAEPAPAETAPAEE